MRTTTIHAAVLMLAGTTAAAQLRFVDLLPGYEYGSLEGISADGSTLGVLAGDATGLRIDTHAWGEGGWIVRPNPSPLNFHQGLSHDGGRQLVTHYPGGYAISIFEGDALINVESSSYQELTGGLTRDGGSVLFARSTGSLPLPTELAVWAGGQTLELGAMPGRYGAARGLLVGSGADRFVVNTELSGASSGQNEERAVYYEAGSYHEIGTLDAGSFVRSTATGMSADGSVVVGYQLSGDGPSGSWSAHSWMLDGSGLRELAFDGLTGVRVGSVTDDGGLVTGWGYNASGGLERFVARTTGEVWLMSDLLAGMGLPTGWTVRDILISADGTTIGGELYHDTSDLRPSFFLYTIPAAGVLFPFAGLGLLAARRRRIISR